MVVPNDEYQKYLILHRKNPMLPKENPATSSIHGYNLVPVQVVAFPETRVISSTNCNLYPPHLTPDSHLCPPPPLISDEKNITHRCFSNESPALYSQLESVSIVDPDAQIRRFHHNIGGTNDYVQFGPPPIESLPKVASEYHGLQQSRLHANPQSKPIPDLLVKGMDVKLRPVYPNCRQRNRISDNKRQSIISAGREGKFSYKKLAKVFKVGPSSIRNILQRNNIKAAHSRKGQPKQQLRLPK